MEMLHQLATHEVGHGLVAAHLNGKVVKYTFDLEKGTGAAHFKVKFDKHTRALIAIAGYAAEVIEFGIETIAKRGSKGLSGDSKKLRSLGYDTQDKMAKLLQEAIDLLKNIWGKFQKERDRVFDQLTIKLRQSDYTPTIF